MRWALGSAVGSAVGSKVRIVVGSVFLLKTILAGNYIDSVVGSAFGKVRGAFLDINSPLEETVGTVTCF